MSVRPTAWLYGMYTCQWGTRYWGDLLSMLNSAEGEFLECHLPADQVRECFRLDMARRASWASDAHEEIAEEINRAA